MSEIWGNSEKVTEIIKNFFFNFWGEVLWNFENNLRKFWITLKEFQSCNGNILRDYRENSKIFGKLRRELYECILRKL